MAESEPQQVDAILDSFREIFRHFQRAMAPHWLQLDLTMAQLRVLIVLAQSGPATVGAIAKRLDIGLPTASHLVERLVRQDLVKRSEHLADRRQVMVYLTEQGEELIGHLRNHRMDQLRTWLLSLSPESLTMLYQGMQALTLAMPPVIDENTHQES